MRSTMRVLSRLLLIGVVLCAAAPPAWAQDQIRYYHTDAIGSVRMVTDENGDVIARYDYTPFGQDWPTLAAPVDPRGFGGKERDQETGLDYFGGRYYQGSTGRFTTVDPVVDGPVALSNPQRWNRYTYVGNNPLSYVDPDGRTPALAAPVIYYGAAAAVASVAWLASPAGQEAVSQVIDDLDTIITLGVDSIGSWFRSEGRGEPPQLKAGKEEHKKAEVRPGEKPEVRTASGKGRMDRYDEDKAHIREIKPDNARGRRTGQRQLERYKKEQEGATERPHTTELTLYPKKPDPGEPH